MSTPVKECARSCVMVRPAGSVCTAATGGTKAAAGIDACVPAHVLVFARQSWLRNNDASCSSGFDMGTK
jgi:hypothetical protein